MTERDIAQKAIDAVLRGTLAFCKFLSANDTGETGGHQSGIYIPKTSVAIIFDEQGEKGANKDRWAKIEWQGREITTDVRFIYYGRGTRDEYRITNFGRGFPFLRPEYTGALFVLVKESPDDYEGYVLNSDEEIQQFLDSFSLTPAQTNRLINTERSGHSKLKDSEVERFIGSLKGEFPSSDVLARASHQLVYRSLPAKNLLISDPDRVLLEWTEEEFVLFQAIEDTFYGERVREGFDSVGEFVVLANKILNRRKSRAGKSLEHHLAAIFDGNEIRYTAQATTEGNKKPDFLFPSEEDYHNLLFPVEKLCSLAAKTTCKDRWRQILNEGNRFRDRYKYLCTLQQGISVAQMDEMEAEKVILVVPRPYIPAYPKERRNRIWTIARFISFVREMEGV